MKQLLTLAIVLSTASAFAARSRTAALGDAAHLSGTGTVYSNPASMFRLNDSLTLETGKTDVVAGTDNADEGAEALLIKSHGDAKWALSLGHDDSTIYAGRNAAHSGTFDVLAQQNPFELSYGMKMDEMAVAGTLVYSNYNDKKAEVKESTMGLRLGAETSVWYAAVHMTLADKWEDSAANDEYKGNNIAVEAGYWIASDLYAYANLHNYGYEVTDSGTVTSEIKSMDIEVGVINTVKKDGNEFFYGVGLSSGSEKDSKGTERKETSLALPLIIGVEADAASWLTLRGSVQQSVLIQDEKVETTAGTTSEVAPGTNSTTFAAGAGLKLGKITVDGSILAAGSQDINFGANNLLGTVGLTYNF